MTKPDEALKAIIEFFTPVNPERISLFEAKGRVMAEPAVSRRTLPAGNTSVLDGYAIKESDVARGTPLTLKVNGVIAAGDDTRKLSTPEGTCWRIMTGAMLPTDTDRIVMHELTDNGMAEVTINSIPERTGVRTAGEEANTGDVIDHTGERITMAHMAELTARGAHYISVYRKPRIAVLSTGNEVVDAGTQDNPLKIFDSNSIAIKTILEDAGCEVSYMGIGNDDPDALCALLKSLSHYDLIITSGGASAGDFDYFSRMPERLGIEWRFFHVEQRPAQPVSFGTAHGTPIFSLPGTPVGSILCTLLYVKPAAKALAGYKHPQNTLIKAVLQEPIEKGVNCMQYNLAFCAMEETLKAWPKPIANYSLKTLAASNAILAINNGVKGRIEAGTELDVIIFDYDSIINR